MLYHGLLYTLLIHKSLLSVLSTIFVGASAVVSWRALVHAVKIRNDSFRPVLDVRKASPVDGIFEAEQEDLASQLAGGVFHFDICNVGPGTAVLGDDPFRLPIYTNIEITQMDLGAMNIKDDVIVVREKNPIENTLRPEETRHFTFGLIGNGKPIPENYDFTVYYQDVLGRHYTTKVVLKSENGSVVSIKVTAP